MGKKMFVGGLPYEVTESQLTAMFAACGKVVSAKVIKDRETGLSKGFGFVEMGTDAEAAAAIAQLNNSSVGARRIIVNEARPMEPRPAGGFPEKKSFSPRPGGPAPRPGGFGGKPSFSDRPSFGDKPGYDDKRGGRGDKRGGHGDKRGGFDEKRGGFGGKKGGKKGGKGHDDDGGDSW